MIPPTHSARTTLAAVGLALLAALPAGARDELRLRVNDAIAAPGGLAAVVVRTYASRPIGQGLVCVVARPGGGGPSAEGTPFAELVDYRVFSRGKDALSVAELALEDGGQTVVLEFSSPSATVNAQDGPLAVLFFRLRDDLRPGQRFALRVDVGQSMVFDPAGGVIPIENRSGELEIRSPAAPLTIEAERDRVAPGETAELGVETFEPRGVASGQIGFRYDPSIAAGTPRVRMDRRYGKRRFSVDASEPGLVLVTLRSRRASINSVPGEIVSIDLPTSRGVKIGTRSTVSLDPSLTFLVDAEGEMMPLRLKRKTVVFEADD